MHKVGITRFEINFKNLSDTRRIHWTVRLKETNKKVHSLSKYNSAPLDTWDKGKNKLLTKDERENEKEYDYKILRNDDNRRN